MKQSPYQLLMGVVLLGTVAFLSWQAGGLAAAGMQYIQSENGPGEQKQAVVVIDPVRLDLKTEDERVIRYLKGETISLVNEEEPVKGWCLVTVEGFPLGWAKGNGMTLKNKYYAGWRWQ